MCGGGAGRRLKGGGKEVSGANAPPSGAGSCVTGGGNRASGANASLCGAGSDLKNGGKNKLWKMHRLTDGGE